MAYMHNTKQEPGTQKIYNEKHGSCHQNPEHIIDPEEEDTVWSRC